MVVSRFDQGEGDQGDDHSGCHVRFLQAEGKGGRAPSPLRGVAQAASPLTGERASAAKVTTPRTRSGGMSRGQ